METDKKKDKIFKINSPDGVKEVKFTEPTDAQIRLADAQASKKFAQLFAEKDSVYMLRSKLYKKLEEENVISKEDMKRAEEIAKELEENKRKISRKELTKSNDMRSMLIKNVDLQSELFAIYGQRQKYEELTIEKQRDNEQIHWLMCQTAVYKNGKSVFAESPAEVDRTSSFYNEVHSAFLDNIYGTDDDIENSIVEIQLLRKFGFIDEDNNYIDRKTKKRVDKDGNEVSDEILSLESMEGFELED